MICNCGGMMKSSTWETVDGWTHHTETCPGCGRVHRWPDSKIVHGQRLINPVNKPVNGKILADGIEWLNSL